ncbi:hypothetical protein HG536_0A06300 [Torulaspora globosa]|uniref:Uncharacterized protein n=1 Tax=Torulaspora globosa TaxID=48254 RepID=A0A7G3ZBC9_9SACH|nr:uncharacterized protein HG536_0A06300 [Torulaspora globosa]QLL30815.1 hypothetical protein HG536_0A06300 [Torulaspora globosa]
MREARRGGNGREKARGLQTEVNPLLLSSNLNLVRRQYKDENPYLSTTGIRTDRKVTKRLQRGLRFHTKGQISTQIELEREEERLRHERQLEQERTEAIRRAKEKAEIEVKIAEGEVPDSSLGEEKYIKKAEDVPIVEWWDKVYLDEHLNILPKYREDFEDRDEDTDEDDEDNHPSIRYVEHPVPVKVQDVKLTARVYLTKKEQKKVRRNRRKIEREAKETKIKLGLEPKPEPKVKLANMMSVYENDQNITDPTQWERTVIEQVEQRAKVHFETNRKRHEEAVEKRKARLQDSTTDSQLDNYCKVFRFGSLANPKIRYKLNTNSRQLSLRGACLRVNDDGQGIIIVAGTEKSCRFFEKLVLRRIKWDEDFEDRENGTQRTMTGNYVTRIWQGYLKTDKFSRWFMKVCNDEEELRQTLRQFDAEHFFTTLMAR